VVLRKGWPWSGFILQHGLTVEDVIRRSGGAEEPAPAQPVEQRREGVIPSASSGSHDSPVVAPPAEFAADECAVCFDSENECVFLPCRHEFCASCARQLRRRVVCPLCRGDVQSIVPKSSPDLAPAAAPPSGAAPAQAAVSEAPTQLTAMVFAPEQARNALDASGGNIEVAVGMLQGETADPTATLAQAPADDSEAVAQLTSMGFAADQARHALEATGGDVQNAAALLLDS